MTRQWHPIFGFLLRPSLEGYYELLTSLPVGEAPRQADIALLRRTTSGSLPFTSLWSHLAIWNVVEFKGPTVRPRREHAAALLEVGLGIARKLNAERRPKKPVPAEEIAFWYLANRLSSRYLEWFREKAGTLVQLGDGLWRSSCWGHPIYLVSGVDLPIDEETIPLHMVGEYDWEKECAVAEYVGSKDSLIMRYGSIVATLHQEAWKEVGGMAKAKRKGLEFDYDGAVEFLGVEGLIQAVGAKRVLETLGAKQVLDTMGLEHVIETAGLEQVIETAGLENVLQKLDERAVKEYFARKESSRKAKGK